MEEGDVPVSDTKESLNANTSEESRETPVNHPIGIRKDSSKKLTWPIAQLKCLYTNAGSMKNKWEELEATVRLENYALIAITETWWDESLSWNIETDNYKIYRRNRHVRKGWGHCCLC